MFDHLGHLLFLGLKLLLAFLLLILFALLRCHVLELGLLSFCLFAQLFKLFLLLLVALLLSLCRWGLFPVLFAFRTSSFRKPQSHNLIDHAENDLKNFECLLHRLRCRTDLDFGAHENRVLVVDLLIGHVEFKQAVTIFLENFADGLVDKLVGNFFIFTQNDKMIFAGLLTSLFLVLGWFWNRQVTGTDGKKKRFEMFVHLVGGLLAGLFGEEKLDWVGRRTTVVAT